jgi:hypothetical protein
VLDDAAGSDIVERGVLDKDPVVAESELVPLKLFVSLVLSEIELLSEFEIVCELLWKAPLEVVSGPDEDPVIDSLGLRDPTLDVRGIPEPLVDPVVGSEVLAIEEVAVSLVPRVLLTPLSVDDAANDDDDDDEEEVIVREFDPLRDAVPVSGDARLLVNSAEEELVIGNELIEEAPEAGGILFMADPDPELTEGSKVL